MPADDALSLEPAKNGRAASPIRWAGVRARLDRWRRIFDYKAVRYLVALAIILAAISASFMVGSLAERPWAFPLYAAVVASAWFGAGPGWLAVIVATVAVEFFWASPQFSFSIGSGEFPWVASFVVCALMSFAWSSQRRRTQSALERTVDQRTADLQRTNTALQLEIVERQAAEDDLRRSEALLAQGQKLSRTGSWTLRLPGGEMRWSAQLFDMLGAERDTAPPTYHRFIERLHPDDRARVKEAIDRAAEEGGEIACEARIALPGQPTLHVQAVGEVKRDPADGTEIIGTIIDLTERKRTERALRDAEAELASMLRLATLAELAAAIAHEINQPLAAITANGSALLRSLSRQPPLLDTAREAATCIVEDGHRAGEVISGIRALFNKEEPKQQPLTINEVIRHVLELSRGMIDRQRVVVRTELSEPGPIAIGDPVQLQQVLVNLVTNAVEAMSRVRGRPRVLTIGSTSEPDGTVAVTVEDTGKGVDPDDAGRIFQSFYTTKKGGIGVGLAVSRSIIEAHGGTLTAAPAGARGALFRFTLPLASGSAERTEVGLSALR